MLLPCRLGLLPLVLLVACATEEGRTSNSESGVASFDSGATGST
jgi:hypothetical protein